MSVGCIAADQHHCVQTLDDKLLAIIRSFPINLQTAVIVNLPSIQEKIYLSRLLGYQQHTNIILVLETGHCKIVDDLDFDRSITLIACTNANLEFNFQVEQSCKINLDLFLQSSGNIVVSGIYNLKDKALVEISTSQNHLQRDACSNVLIKGVVQDEASIHYSGKIFVAKDAPGSVVSQKNKTLILSSQAKAFSMPTMEVLNKDVQCAHGSAVAYVQEEQLFYLMSRGLSRKVAVAALVDAFLEK